MIIDVGYWTRILKNIAVLVISLIIIFLAFKLAIFYIPFLIGFIISLLVDPLIRFVTMKTKLERKKGAIIVLAIIFCILLALLAWGIISLITESSNLLKGLNNYIQMMYNQISNYIGAIKEGRTKLPEEIVTIIENSSSRVMEYITNYVSSFLTKATQIISEIPTIGIYTFITLLATYFICTDRMYIRDAIEHQIPNKWARRISRHTKEIIKELGNYLKAEAILILISFIIVLIGLYMLKILNFNVPYPFLTALAIGFVDALPILGSGTIMIPWAIIEGLNGDIKLGIAIIILYAIILIVRQLIEPRVVSGRIGIHPIFTLIAMYTGFRVIGILGLFIGPIVLIILKNIFSVSIENGIIKSIFL